MNIIVKVIPHETQRYDTVGDWYFNDEKTELYVMVSDMGNPKYEFLVAFHEQIEAMECLHAGIPEEVVSAFDIEFEKNRQEGNLEEPGNSPNAPYYKQHEHATKLEFEMAAKLGVDWGEYDDAIMAL